MPRAWHSRPLRGFAAVEFVGVDVNLWNLRILRRRFGYSLIRTNSSTTPDGILSLTRSTSRKPYRA